MSGLGNISWQLSLHLEYTNLQGIECQMHGSRGRSDSGVTSLHAPDALHHDRGCHTDKSAALLNFRGLE